MSGLRTGSDAAIRRYLELIEADIEPDPLYRRRLRGSVVNRFVAAREGLAVAPMQRRHGVTSRIGRASLMAGLVLAISVSGALAASQEALPGDLLYPIKLRIEEFRFRVLPHSLHDDLEAQALVERISEMQQLADSGRAEAAATLAASVTERHPELVDAPDDSSKPLGVRSPHVEFQALLERLPEPARIAIERAVERTADEDRTGPPQGEVEPKMPGNDRNDNAWGQQPGEDNGEPNDGARPDGQPGNADARASATPGATPKPTKSHKSTKDPRPTAPAERNGQQPAADR